MRPPDPPLSDDAIVLRPWSSSDTPEIVRCCNDPLVPRFIPMMPVPYTPDDAARYIARTEENPGELNLAITDRTTGGLLGAVGFSLKEDDPAVAEIGYWLAPEARGRGAATRALRLLSVWLLRTHPVARLQLHTDVENTRSQAVAERAGFTREGVLRASMESRGARRDSVVFSLLPREV